MDWITSRIDLHSIGGLSHVLQKPYGLFALLVLVVVVLYGLSVGKTKALVSLLSLYVAYMLTMLFPFSGWLEQKVVLPEGAPVLNALLFAVLYIATFFLLSRSMRSRLSISETPIFKVVIISVIQLGLLSSIVISLLPSEFAMKAFGPAYLYLAGDRTLWLWAVSSLLIMPFMKGSRRSD